MLISATYVCQVCWQSNTTTVDGSQGEHQQYVEDCHVCCRPMLLTVSVHDGTAVIDAESEVDA